MFVKIPQLTIQIKIQTCTTAKRPCLCTEKARQMVWKPKIKIPAIKLRSTGGNVQIRLGLEIIRSLNWLKQRVRVQLIHTSELRLIVVEILNMSLIFTDSFQLHGELLTGYPFWEY